MKYRLLGRTGVFVILGARTTDQLSANIAATELKLTERDRLSSAR